MHRKDSGAFGTHVHGHDEAFEAMSDLRRDRFFRLVETGTVSTTHRPLTLIDTKSSEMKEPRPSTGTEFQPSTTVTYFTPDQFTATQPIMTTGATQPSTERPYPDCTGLGPFLLEKIWWDEDQIPPT